MSAFASKNEGKIRRTSPKISTSEPYIFQYTYRISSIAAGNVLCPFCNSSQCKFETKIFRTLSLKQKVVSRQNDMWDVILSCRLYATVIFRRYVITTCYFALKVACFVGVLSSWGGAPVSDCWPVYVSPLSAVRTVLFSFVLSWHLAFIKYANNTLKCRHSTIFANNLKEGIRHKILALIMRFFVFSEERQLCP